jgi:uncharacterized protein (TIGR02172 family)
MPELGTLIAQGRTAEIYTWEDGWVMKLFHPWVSSETVTYEANLSRIAYVAGLPVPEVGEIIKINDRFGLALEFVKGISMLKAIKQQPWKSRSYAQMLAVLHVELHNRTVMEMPSQRERLIEKIKHAKPLPEELLPPLLDKLTHLPDGNQLCHGDFHPDNIILTKKGPVIIDWIDATAGSPAADVARSVILMGGGALPPGSTFSWLLQAIRGFFQRAYLQHYSQLQPDIEAEVKSWIPIVAASRLSEGITEEETWLLELARGIL